MSVLLKIGLSKKMKDPWRRNALQTATLSQQKCIKV